MSFTNPSFSHWLRNLRLKTWGWWIVRPVLRFPAFQLTRVELPHWPTRKPRSRTCSPHDVLNQDQRRHLQSRLSSKACRLSSLLMKYQDTSATKSLNAFCVNQHYPQDFGDKPSKEAATWEIKYRKWRRLLAWAVFQSLPQNILRFDPHSHQPLS